MTNLLPFAIYSESILDISWDSNISIRFVNKYFNEYLSISNKYWEKKILEVFQVLYFKKILKYKCCIWKILQVFFQVFLFLETKQWGKNMIDNYLKYPNHSIYFLLTAISKWPWGHNQLIVYCICICICLTPRRHSLGHIEAVLLDRLSAATHEILG